VEGPVGFMNLQLNDKPQLDKPLVVSTLVGHRDANMALTCLGSFVDFSVQKMLFRIHDDGTLTSADKQKLAEKLPVLRFVERGFADDRVTQILKKYPACLRYRSRHVLGLKLFDVALFSQEEDLAFCDSDILFFRPFAGLFSWPDKGVGSLFMQDFQEAYALRPWEMLRHIALPRRLNSGLFLIRGKYYDLDLIEAVIAHDYRAFEIFPYWLEQTCWGALAWRSNVRFWSPRQLQVIKNADCLNENMIAGHFTSSVRNLLNKATARIQTGVPVVPIFTEPMRKLRSHHILVQQTLKSLKRRLGRKKDTL
jgi:hypothetical protein